MPAFQPHSCGSFSRRWSGRIRNHKAWPESRIKCSVESFKSSGSRVRFRGFSVQGNLLLIGSQLRRYVNHCSVAGLGSSIHQTLSWKVITRLSEKNLNKSCAGMAGEPFQAWVHSMDKHALEFATRGHYLHNSRYIMLQNTKYWFVYKTIWLIVLSHRANLRQIQRRPLVHFSFHFTRQTMLRKLLPKGSFTWGQYRFCCEVQQSTLPFDRDMTGPLCSRMCSSLCEKAFNIETHTRYNHYQGKNITYFW